MPTGQGLTEAVAAWVTQAHSIVVLTGAGISTGSGIPDFRGPNGLWTKNPGAQRLFDLDTYVNVPEVRREAWQRRLEHPAWQARPNDGHRALVDVERSGRLHTLITQNIDGLHQAAGSDPAKVVEIHGNLREIECLGCADRTPTPEVLDRVRAGEEDPPCVRCGGILKTATISFGQALKPEVLRAATDAARSADLFLAVGTSLTVQPAASLAGLAVESGARLVVINAQETPYDVLADAVLREPIGDVLPALVTNLARVSRP